MNIEQWLNQVVQFDEWGRPPSLADVPLRYGPRTEMFELRELSSDDIKIKYQEYKEQRRNNTMDEPFDINKLRPGPWDDDVIKDEKNEGSLVIHEAELELIKWIQDTQSEMDLQTKTSKEILEEYENKKYE